MQIIWAYTDLIFLVLMRFGYVQFFGSSLLISNFPRICFYLRNPEICTSKSHLTKYLERKASKFHMENIIHQNPNPEGRTIYYKRWVLAGELSTLIISSILSAHVENRTISGKCYFGDLNRFNGNSIDELFYLYQKLASCRKYIYLKTIL